MHLFFALAAFFAPLRFFLHTNQNIRRQQAKVQINSPRLSRAWLWLVFVFRSHLLLFVWRTKQENSPPAAGRLLLDLNFDVDFDVDNGWELKGLC